MNGDVEVEATRPRPLSGGLWTIFSWLRRTERSSSSESISSVGSDRTAASFDFLSPIYYPNSQPPLILPPNSPTDSYKKRVHERNLRRQNDRGVTLHRKYGLWREEGGYDGFSLPQVHNTAGLAGNNQSRCRRAASECLQRRAAHVPGKRRAPPPPTFITTSLPRNYKRKRPAPKPPLRIISENKENIQVNNSHLLINSPDRSSSNTVIFQSSKSTYFQDNQGKEAKLRPEKSFIKQIFENKKRHSAIDISHVKLLPSISELDRQAAEIIKTNKLLRHNCDLKDLISEQNKILISGTMWMCTNCLRKYNMTVTSCVYCVHKSDLRHTVKPSNASSTSTQTELNRNKAQSSTQFAKEIDEKKKLKEMLKEMKYSLPKKSNYTEIKNFTISDEEHTHSTETPTLRIGSTIIDNKVKNCNNSTSNSKGTICNTHSKESSESLIRAIITTSNKPMGKSSASLENKPSTINHIPGILNNNSPLSVISLNNGDGKNNIENSILKENSGQFTTQEHKETKSEHKQVNKKTATEVIKMKDLNSSSDKLSENLNVSQSLQNKITSSTSFTPLRISSLLNPVSQPKITSSNSKSQVSPILINIESNAAKDTLPMKFENLHTSDNLKSEIITSPVKNRSQNKDTSSNSSSNKVKLDPKIVSQIIKKSIDKSQKCIPGSELKAEASADTSTGGINDHTKRRDLINQLELSIAKGDEKSAAEAAAKLAKLRLSCSVLSFSSQIVSGPSTSRIIVPKQEKNNYTNGDSVQFEEENTKFVKDPTSKLNMPDRNVFNKNKVKIENAQQNVGQDKILDDNIVSIEVWIEDKLATRGPVRLNIPRQSTVADLRREAAISLGLADNLQRWIVGKTLCTDNNEQIFSLAGASFNAPFYLCLVESEENKSCNEAEKTSKENQSGDFYTELIKLEQQALVLNTENYECGVCIEDCAVGNGAVLRECLHTFCKECLSDVVRHSEEPVVSCPAIGCLGVLQDREIRALLSEDDYEKWLARGLAAAESGIRNTFHCRTPDCSGWAFCEAGVRIFPCPVCKKRNCVLCQAVHDGDTCEQYQRKLRETITVAESNNADEGTQALLNSLITRGEALECPECRAIITKKWGCDWVKCSACKTEICWVTKGRRWGPAGRGDTSGGCRCGVDGQRCHPTCGYCH